MRRGNTHSDLLKHVVSNSSENSGISHRIECLADLLESSRILPTRIKSKTTQNKRDEFHWRLLGEIFRDVSFYFRQTQKDKVRYRGRLERSVRAFIGISNSVNESLLKSFLVSVEGDQHVLGYVISRLENS